MSQYKIIIIITSCINVDSSPLSYFHTRSVFSPEERLQQTVFTLQKLREKIPHAKLILANNNYLTDEQKNILMEHCDTIYNIDDTKVKTHPNKSFSECVSLLNTCQYILDSQIEFDYVFKTSGRYYLMDEFDINKWPFNEQKIVTPRSGDGVVNNVIYSVSKHMINYYMNRLKQCIELCDKDHNNSMGYNVEAYLFDFKNENVHEFLKIPAYVAGMCSVQPRVFWSC